MASNHPLSSRKSLSVAIVYQDSTRTICQCWQPCFLIVFAQYLKRGAYMGQFHPQVEDRLFHMTRELFVICRFWILYASDRPSLKLGHTVPLSEAHQSEFGHPVLFHIDWRCPLDQDIRATEENLDGIGITWMKVLPVFCYVVFRLNTSLKTKIAMNERRQLSPYSEVRSTP